MPQGNKSAVHSVGLSQRTVKDGMKAYNASLRGANVVDLFPQDGEPETLDLLGAVDQKSPRNTKPPELI